MSSNQHAPVAKINLPKGMENIITSRPSRYEVGFPVDPTLSSPTYVSPVSADVSDPLYSTENIVQPRHSAYSGICFLNFFF